MSRIDFVFFKDGGRRNSKEQLMSWMNTIQAQICCPRNAERWMLNWNYSPPQHMHDVILMFLNFLPGQRRSNLFPHTLYIIFVYTLFRTFLCTTLPNTTFLYDEFLPLFQLFVENILLINCSPIPCSIKVITGLAISDIFSDFIHI